MDIINILHQSWSISWRRWELWALLIGSFLAFTPAVLLIGAIAGLSVLIAEPGLLNLPTWLVWAEDMNGWSWAGLGLLALIILVVTTILAVIFQSGASRIAAYVAEGRPGSLGEALSFTRPQLVRVIRLGLVFGAVNGLIALLPVILPTFLPPGPGREALVSLLQASFSPFSMILGIVLLVLLISVALEDLVPRVGVSSIDVFRSGWWGFLLVVAISFVAGIAVTATLFIPLVPIVTVNLIFPNTLLALLPCYGLVALLFLFLLLFTSVYSLVLFTLVYRAAAAQASTKALLST